MEPATSWFLVRFVTTEPCAANKGKKKKKMHVFPVKVVPKHLRDLDTKTSPGRDRSELITKWLIQAGSTLNGEILPLATSNQPQSTQEPGQQIPTR